MAETTDPVAIVVDIVSNVEDEVKKIKSQLREIGFGDIEKDLDIQNVEEQIATEQAKLTAWASDDIEKDVNITGFQAMMDEGALDQMTREHLGRMTRDITGSEIRPPEGMADFHEMDDVVDVDGILGGDRTFFDELAPMEFDMDRGLGGIVPDDDDGPNFLKKLTNSSEGFNKNLKNLMPNMMMWWNILAALIPIMVTLVGLVIGLVAALGALAVAGAAIVGVGLLGWGRNAKESLQNLKEEAMDLGSTLFDVLQPAARAFQPILQDAMQGIPAQVEKLVGPLRGLTVFQDELGDIGGGIVEWLAMVIESITELDDVAGQVAIEFGRAFGNFINEALTKMLKDVHRNQQAYMQLAAILMNLLLIVFNLMKAISMALSQFVGLTEAIKALTALLSNKWVVAMLTVLTAVILLEIAIDALASSIAIIKGAGFASILASWIPNIQLVIGKIWTLTAALGALRYALFGIAGLAVGAGAWLLGKKAVESMSGPTGAQEHPRGGRPGGNTFINIQGDVREREMDRLLDQVGTETRSEMAMQESMGAK